MNTRTSLKATLMIAAGLGLSSLVGCSNTQTTRTDDNASTVNTSRWSENLWSQHR